MQPISILNAVFPQSVSVWKHCNVDDNIDEKTYNLAFLCRQNHNYNKQSIQRSICTKKGPLEANVSF